MKKKQKLINQKRLQNNYKICKTCGNFYIGNFCVLCKANMDQLLLHKIKEKLEVTPWIKFEELKKENKMITNFLFNKVKTDLIYKYVQSIKSMRHKLVTKLPKK